MRIMRAAMMGLCSVVATTARAEPDERLAISGTIAAYQRALDAGDVDASMDLYTVDGAVLTPGRPTIAGRHALRQAYEEGAKAIAFDVAFDVEEIDVVSHEWAFVRTKSTGASRLKASNVIRSEANQELFILRRDDEGRWRIKEYGFSPTRPAS